MLCKRCGNAVLPIQRNGKRLYKRIDDEWQLVGFACSTQCAIAMDYVEAEDGGQDEMYYENDCLRFNTIDGYLFLQDRDSSPNDYGYEFCSNCNCYFNVEREDYISNGEIYFCCEDCAESWGMVRCCDCGNWFDESDTHETIYDDDRVCENCFNFQNWSRCSECGQALRDDDVYYDEECGDPYCERCFDEYGNKNYIKEYHHYNNWQAKYTEEQKNENNVFLGFELEIESPNNYREEVAEAVNDITNKDGELVVFENDGSLDDGFETISHPATIEYWRENQNKIKDMLRVMASYGCKSHDTTTCGLHIHFTRSYLDQDAISRLIYIVEKCKNELVMFSRRRIDDLNHWASFLNIDRKDLSIDFIKSYGEDSARYRAVNLQNRKTIEIRIFKGTLKFESFMSCLELVDNLVKLAKNTTDAEIVRKTFTDVVEYNKTEYLKAYCLERRIIGGDNNVYSDN